MQCLNRDRGLFVIAVILSSFVLHVSIIYMVTKNDYQVFFLAMFFKTVYLSINNISIIYLHFFI